MRKYLLGALLGVLLYTPAWAGNYFLLWPVVQGATGYTIEQSIDAGKTWTVVYTGTNPGVIVTTTVPQLYLYRLSATNAAGTVLRADVGAWIDSTKPQIVGGLGIQ